MLERFKTIFFCALVWWLCLSCNPFAPGLDSNSFDRSQILGDRTTLPGFFEWFQNAYQMRDTSLYGQIIDKKFRFTFFDFENNREQYWDRDSEMQTTYNMFLQVDQIALVWNNFVYVDTMANDTLANVERMFNLTIVHSEQQVYRGTGSAQLTLVRSQPGLPWRIRSWFDKSDF